jgi:hypothetical protein
LIDQIGYHTPSELVRVLEMTGKDPATMYEVFFSTSMLVKKDWSKLAKQNVGCNIHIANHVVIIPQHDDINEYKYYNGFIVYLKFDIKYPSTIIPLVIKEIQINKNLFNITSPAGVVEDK